MAICATANTAAPELPVPPLADVTGLVRLLKFAGPVIVPSCVTVTVIVHDPFGAIVAPGFMPMVLPPEMPPVIVPGVEPAVHTTAEPPAVLIMPAG